MARTRTMAQLVADVRFRSDTEGLTARHTDAAIGRLINESWQAMREYLVDHGEPAYLKQATGNLTAGVLAGTSFGSLALPADAVRVFGLSVLVSGSYVNLDPLPFSARNDESTPGVPRSFFIYNLGVESTTTVTPGRIALFPAPDAAYTYSLWYLPAWADIDVTANPTYVFDGVAGWEQCVIWDCVVKIAARDDDMRNTYAIAVQEREMAKTALKAAATSHQRAGAMRRGDTRGRRETSQSREAWRR